MKYCLFLFHDYTKWTDRVYGDYIGQFRVCRKCGKKQVKKIMIKDFDHVHDWEKWKVVKEGNIVDSSKNPDIPIGSYKNLERKCKKCGMIETDRKRW